MSRKNIRTYNDVLWNPEKKYLDSHKNFALTVSLGLAINLMKMKFRIVNDCENLKIEIFTDFETSKKVMDIEKDDYLKIVNLL